MQRNTNKGKETERETLRIIYRLFSVSPMKEDCGKKRRKSIDSDGFIIWYIEVIIILEGVINVSQFEAISYIICVDGLVCIAAVVIR